jgi:hypothetical protein
MLDKTIILKINNQNMKVKAYSEYKVMVKCPLCGKFISNKLFAEHLQNVHDIKEVDYSI